MILMIAMLLGVLIPILIGLFIASLVLDDEEE